MIPLCHSFPLDVAASNEAITPNSTSPKSAGRKKNSILEQMRSRIKFDLFQNSSPGNAYDGNLNVENCGDNEHSIFKFFNEEEKEDIEEENQDKQIGIFHMHPDQYHFKDLYTEAEILGEGCVGLVKKCFKNCDKTIYAVKIVKTRDKETIYNVKKEFQNIVKLDHPNIVKVLELYIDPLEGKIYTVMELVEASEMFEAIKLFGSYSEEIAIKIFKQILLAIQYMHCQGVVHRDLKPNNILCNRNGSQVKITDFNVSKFDEKRKKTCRYGFSKEKIKMWTYTGTIAFTAPEILKETEYNEAVDMWSAGVVLYTMLCGYQPFSAEYVEDLIKQIIENKLEFNKAPWEEISLSAKDLILRCLTTDPKQRISPTDALMHPWIAHTRTNMNLIPKDFFSNLDGSIRGLVKSRTNIDLANSPSASSSEYFANSLDNEKDHFKNLQGIIEDEINCEDEKESKKDIDIKSFESERDIYKIGKQMNQTAKLSKFHAELKGILHDKKVSFLVDGDSEDELGDF